MGILACLTAAPPSVPPLSSPFLSCDDRSEAVAVRTLYRPTATRSEEEPPPASPKVTHLIMDSHAVWTRTLQHRRPRCPLQAFLHNYWWHSIDFFFFLSPHPRIHLENIQPKLFRGWVYLAVPLHSPQLVLSSFSEKKKELWPVEKNYFQMTYGGISFSM